MLLFLHILISGIQVTKEYQSFVSATQVRRKDGSAISSIIIRRVSTKHTGTYSCRPANLEPAQIKLHVIRGKFDYHFLSLSFNQKLSNMRIPMAFMYTQKISQFISSNEFSFCMCMFKPTNLISIMQNAQKCSCNFFHRIQKHKSFFNVNYVIISIKRI